MSTQGTPAWFAERCGCVTASRIADALAKTKSGWGASRAQYRAQLVAERLTGTVAETYSNAAMQWGTDTEPQARAAYTLATDTIVVETGYVPHPTIAMSGASPDGLVAADGLVEIKCPSTATHIDTLLGQAIPERYILQMYWQMACTGRKWCDYVSFDPRMPEDMRFFRHRLDRDEATIGELAKAVQVLLAEIDDTVARLTAIYRGDQGPPW